ACIAEVVHVFRRAAEVRELERRCRGTDRGELLPEVVLDRLYIVVDPGLDALDRIGCVGGRRIGERARAGACLGTELCPGQLRYARGEMQQPARLDADALANEPCL